MLLEFVLFGKVLDTVEKVRSRKKFEVVWSCKLFSVCKEREVE
jgi:hypothetical protein